MGRCRRDPTWLTLVRAPAFPVDDVAGVLELAGQGLAAA
jgi:hypothetical protein